MHPDVLLHGTNEVISIFGIPVFRKRTKGLTSAQLSEWEAYDKIDPIGDFRGDFRMAYIASIITNAFRSVYGKKGQKKFTAAIDFMPDWEEPYKPKTIRKQSADEMKNVLMTLFKPYTKKEKQAPSNSVKNTKQ